jgi:OOP family OmpA-OmpF porin
MNLLTTRVCCGLLFAAANLAMTPAALAADPLPKDVLGSADPSVLKRFTGATLIGYKLDNWDAATFPVTPVIDTAVQDKPFKNLVTVEGKRTRAIYLAPEGKSPLEVYRNHEQALNAAGFKKKFSCEANCNGVYFAMTKMEVDKGIVWSKGHIPNKSGGMYAPSDALTFEDGRLWVGTLNQSGLERWVLLYVSKAVNDNTNYSQAFVQVVEPKAMQTGQVQVLDAQALKGGLQAEGKMALYGLYFDTGKSEVKPESRPQLEEMAKLLRGQPALQVFIVGHTDNQGVLDANLSLSQQRAQAVVDALVRDHKIDAKRLVARGVANLSPLATNESTEGRSRNRRVELVVR